MSPVLLAILDVKLDNYLHRVDTFLRGVICLQETHTLRDSGHSPAENALLKNTPGLV